MRTVLSRLHAVALAAYVALALVGSLMMGAGNGLPGLVQALSGTDGHVCTCASGGSHASCPVCNHATGASTGSRLASAQGVPCGDHRVVAAASCDPGTLPAPFVALAQVVRRVDTPLADEARAPERHVEPATPPPRIALPG
jgi:hypothetical protein